MSNGRNNRNEAKASGSETESTPAASAQKHSLLVLSEREHQQKYPERVEYDLKNKLRTPLSVNICSGKDCHFWTKDANGHDAVNPDATEQMKTCPGQYVQLLGLEKKRVGVCAVACVDKSAHLSALERQGHLSVRKV